MGSLKKWLHGAIPALLIHCSIGTIYCWGTFSQNIADYVGTQKSTITWAFTIAIFVLGMAAAFCGNMVEKNIKRASVIAMVCFFLGMAGTGLFIYLKSVVGIFLCYGVIMGIGVGFGYLCPVKNLMLWFKEHKGLATGISVAGFGAAKAIATPIMTALLDGVGVWMMFIILACVYLVLMLVGTILLKEPEDWVQNKVKLTPKEFFGRFKVFGNPTFLGVWLVFFVNVTAGLMIIQNEKAIYTVAGASLSIIALLGSISAIFNAVGRIAFSTVGDMLKSRNTIYKIILIMSLAICGIGFATYGSSPITFVIVALVFLINAGYGGGFSNLPTLLSDTFGMENLSSVYGIALSAWGFAGIAAPQIANLIWRDTSSVDGFKALLICEMIMFAVAICIDFILVKKKKNK